jgi:polyhydroxybutyrate depolymerase
MILMAGLCSWHGTVALASNAGADAAACPAAGLAPGWHSLAIASAGRSRAVEVFLPGTADRGALPLVIDLHGSGDNGAEQARSTGLSTVAERSGFVIANPNGGVSFPGEGDAYYWNIPGVLLVDERQVPAGAPDDVQFISDTIDQIAARTCVDLRRVYVTGMSGGARMASLLACRLAHRIAAVAPVTGLRAGLPSADDPGQPDPASCQPQRPVPIVSFHGTADMVNPYDGGGASYWRYGVPAAVRRWAELNHCSDRVVEQRVSARVTLLRRQSCAAGSELWLYRIDAPADQGGGHTWPGAKSPAAAAAGSPANVPPADTPSTEINASELVWDFFKRFQLPAAP